MDALSRLKMLTSQTSFEADVDNRFGTQAPRPADCLEKRSRDLYIHPAVMPNGQHIQLLKTLLTSACERDCYYCPFRAGRDFRRATFRPEEFSRVFMELHRRGVVEGLFLSSGIAGGGMRTQDQVIDTAEILRNKLGYRGYMHLKIMPGAEKDQVLRTMQLADRVSVNLEAPNTERLARLAPHKTFLDELVTRLQWIEEIRRNQPAHSAWKGRWPSSTTQFVAGGSDESDIELLQTTETMYRKLRLARTYFMAFNPIPGTPLEEHAPTPPERELRLYQASFLLRDYGFDMEELPFENNGNLPLSTDPKQAWAQIYLCHSPVEINRAEKHELMRIPGIGPKTAEAILKARKIRTLRDLSSLRKLGVSAEKAAPYILLSGKRAGLQLALF